MNASATETGPSASSVSYYPRLLLGLVGYAAAVYGVLILFEPFTPIFPVWPANAILLVALLMVPLRMMWIGLLAAVLVTVSVAFAVPNGNHFIALVLALCNAVEPAICALAMRNDALTLPNLSQTKTLMRFALFCILLGPLTSGVLGALFAVTYEGGTFLEKFYAWTVPDMLAMGVFAPLLFALNTPALHALLRPEMLRKTLLWLTLIAIVTFTLFAEHEYSLLVLLAPLMLAGVFFLDFVSVVLGVFLITFIAIGFVVVEQDSFMHMSAHLSLGNRILLLQFFILVLLTMIFPAAAGIAERRRLERALRRSEGLYRLLADNTDDVILLLDENFKRIYVSPAVQRVYGYAPEALIGKSPLETSVHEEDRALLRAAFDALRDGTESINAVYRIQRAENEWHWIEAVYKRVRTGEPNEPMQFVAALRDISHRKAAEQALAEANRHLEKLAATDGLTGIANRHGFDRALNREWQRGLRAEQMPGLLLLDVDYFKKYNDYYGHQAGDAVLKKVAQAIQDSLRRPGDLAARYGGEEFGVILPDTDVLGCMDVAHNICTAIQMLDIEHAHGINGKLTVSIGVACLTYDVAIVTSEVHLIECADRALYRAKHAGRDCVVCYDEKVDT